MYVFRDKSQTDPRHWFHAEAAEHLDVAVSATEQNHILPARWPVSAISTQRSSDTSLEYEHEHEMQLLLACLD